MRFLSFPSHVMRFGLVPFRVLLMLPFSILLLVTVIDLFSRMPLFRRVLLRLFSSLSSRLLSVLLWRVLLIFQIRFDGGILDTMSGLVGAIGWLFPDSGMLRRC